MVPLAHPTPHPKQHLKIGSTILAQLTVLTIDRQTDTHTNHTASVTTGHKALKKLLRQMRKHVLQQTPNKWILQTATMIFIHIHKKLCSDRPWATAMWWNSRTIADRNVVRVQVNASVSRANTVTLGARLMHHVHSAFHRLPETVSSRPSNSWSTHEYWVRLTQEHAAWSTCTQRNLIHNSLTVQVPQNVHFQLFFAFILQVCPPPTVLGTWLYLC